MIISFGHNDGEWKSKYSFTPKSMMNSATELFSKADDVAIHIHNKGDINSFYDQVSSSAIAVAFNDNPSSNKIFKTISIEGSEPISTRLHNFTPKKSTDLPLQNNFVSTTEGQVRGGIIYHGLEKSSELRNGATMHYVGEISNVSQDGNLENGLQVTLDNTSSDYIPTYDAVYAVYLPDTNEFYFGESDITQEDLSICDIISLFVLTSSYDVSTGVDDDGVIDSITVSIPVIPNSDPSDISVRAVKNLEPIEGVLNFQANNIYSWTIQLPDIDSRIGTWNVQIDAVDESGQPCGLTSLGSISILPPKPQDDEGDGPEPVSCEEFVSQDFSVEYGWLLPTEGITGQVQISDEYVQNQGALLVGFDSSLGTSPYSSALIEVESGATVYPEAQNGSSNGNLTTFTFLNIPDGVYRLYVIDSNTSPDGFSQVEISGVTGCIYESDIFDFTGEPPSTLPTCEELESYILQNSTPGAAAGGVGNGFTYTIDLGEDLFNQFPTEQAWAEFNTQLVVVGNVFYNADGSQFVDSLGLDGYVAKAGTFSPTGASAIELFAGAFGGVPDGDYYFDIAYGVDGQTCPPTRINFTLSDNGGTGTVTDPTDFIPRFGSYWVGRLFDTDYNGQIGTSDLLTFLSSFGQTLDPNDPFDPVYGVQKGSDSNYDGSVSAADLLNILSSFGLADENHLGPGSLKYPDLGESLEAYVGPDELINPTYFFDDFGNLIQGAPNPNDFGPVEGSVEFQQQNQRSLKMVDGLVSFADLNNLVGLNPSLTPPQAGTFPAVSANNPSQYLIQTLSSGALQYMQNLPANAQLYAFKNPEVYGDDLRGQTAEMLLDLGTEDFELFAVNLNYELVNADHTR